MKIVRGTEGGASWSELAQGDPLAAVLDPGDRTGAKNRAIDLLHKHALTRTCGTLRGRRVLDFGCGTGRLSEWLVRRGAEVDGVDVTPEMISAAQRRVPQARFNLIDGVKTGHADAAFDLVISAYVLQYYVDGDGLLATELARVLRPGGRLVAIEQVADQDLPRGGPRTGYERLLGGAGLIVEAARPIRLSDSWVVATVQRHPRLLQAPGVAQVAVLEARASRRPLVGGRYADYVFAALRRA